jgi:hypothetical protein
MIRVGYIGAAYSNLDPSLGYFCVEKVVQESSSTP